MHVKCPFCKTEFITEEDVDIKNVPHVQPNSNGTFFMVPKRTNNIYVNAKLKSEYEKENETMSMNTNTNSKATGKKTVQFSSELETKGYNPLQYVSLGDLQTILQQMLPQVQATVQAKAIEQTVEEDEEDEDEDTKTFAKNSKFYGKIMEDGNIFNPYLHRRWLPAQYIKMMKYSNRHEQGFEAALRNNYPYQYSITYIKKEVKKLAYLQWADDVSYSERKYFFSLSTVKAIISDYVEKAKEYINNCQVRKYSGNYEKYIKGRGDFPVQKVTIEGKVSFTDSKEIIELKEELNVFARQVAKCNNYKTMSKLLESFEYIILPKDTKKSNAFIYDFKASGAYYTLKHLIMFENLRFKGAKKTTDGCALLRMYLAKKTPAYVFHAMLKEMIKDNDFDTNEMLQA